jgi:hypothetical protein
VVRLIRSKGVGVYFVTQSPGDLPDPVLAQLANRVQHALRAFTPQEQKAVKTAAQTFRSDNSFSVQQAISEMGVGEALISTLMANGAPSFVKRAMVKPPISRIGAASREEILDVVDKSPQSGKYDTTVDRESAFEILAKRAAAAASSAAEKKPPTSRKHSASRTSGRHRQGIGETFLKSIARSLGSRAGGALVRGILGSLFKGR